MSQCNASFQMISIHLLCINVLVVSSVCCMYLDGVVQYSSLSVVSSCNASPKRVAEVEEASARLQRSQVCKENCPARQRRVLYVSG